MCVYIYICTYTHHSFKSMSAVCAEYIYIYIYICHVYIYICMYMYVCVCVCVRLLN